VAHDFNNLLTVINGYGELLLATLGEQEPARVACLRLRPRAHAPHRSPGNCCPSAGGSYWQPAVLDLNAVLLEAQQMLQRMIGEGRSNSSPGWEPALGPVPGRLRGRCTSCS